MVFLFPQMIFYRGRDGSQVVSLLAFHSNHSSSNAADFHDLSVKIVAEKKVKNKKTPM